MEPDRWEFANEGFLRGQRQLLKNIRRRNASSHPQTSHQGLDHCVELGRFGLDSEIDRLRRDKQVLMLELVKLRQQQQSTKDYLKAIEERLEGTEMKQRQMTSFLAKAIQNPSFVQKLVQHKDRRKEIGAVIGKKRGRSIDQGPSNVAVSKLGHGREGEFYVKIDDLELKALAMDIQGLEEEYVDKEEKHHLGDHRVVDVGFWEDFLNEEIEDELD
ncbi:unnamed protein product [Ilex paraguariensis]|uniref:Uncharacterized protein n=1 Tax=Ilex paraguariensis TaxID=185542 RepID=A0ABC8UAR7_9AQUA